MRFGSIAACAACAPLLLAAGPPLHLQPSTRWVLEYAENSCRLSRTFGTGEDETILRFESGAPEDLDMVVFGKPVADRGDQVPRPPHTMDEGVPVAFRPLQGKLMHGRAARSVNEKPAVLVSKVWLLPDAEAAALEAEGEAIDAAQRVRPPPRDPAERKKKESDESAFLTGTTSVEVSPRGRSSVVLETGPLLSAFEALDKCEKQSLRDWGINPDVEDEIVRPAWAPDRLSWVKADDYPYKMLDDGQESTVSARLLIDASGKITRCTSLSHFKLPQFNQLVCDRILKLARFQPAELADGTKVPSYYLVKFVFRIAS